MTNDSNLYIIIYVIKRKRRKIMGLDNGIYVRSNVRKITRSMLPSVIHFTLDEKYDKEGVEICYWRKYWGLRNEVIYSFPSDEDGTIIFDKPSQVNELLKIVVKWINEDRWESDGDSIWSFDEALPNLLDTVTTLAAMSQFMNDNPDVYLEFYDSY